MKIFMQDEGEEETPTEGGEGGEEEPTPAPEGGGEGETV
tara:strand:+ start:5375 stop:5491 length:117 start_codon:yes stop_codon:yes gene_type:complete